MTPTGFYEKFKTTDGIETALENEFIDVNGRREPLQIYLHGLCGVFAIALNRKFGYRMLELADEENGECFHVCCADGNEFVDVRGRTENERTLLEPFEDFFTAAVYETADPERYGRYCREMMGDAAFDAFLDAARTFIDLHRNYYET